MDIAAKLSQLLERREMTQKALAIQIGVSATTVSKWCSGKSSIDSYHLGLVCEALDISADYLLGRTDSLLMNKDPRRWVTDFTGLSTNAISALHKIANSDKDKARVRIDTINAMLLNKRFIALVDEMSDFFDLTAALSSECQEALPQFLDKLAELVPSNDELLSVAYEYYHGGFFTDQDEVEKAKKQRLRKYSKDRQVTLFSIADSASEIAKKNYDAASQHYVGAQVRKFLVGLLNWYHNYFVDEYSSYETINMQDNPGNQPMAFEAFIAARHPLYSRVEETIKDEIRRLEKTTA